MFKYCDNCGELFNWIFPMPQIFSPKRLYFCSKDCRKQVNKIIARKKLKKMLE